MGGGGDGGYLQSPNKTNRVCIYLISAYEHLAVLFLFSHIAVQIYAHHE